MPAAVISNANAANNPNNTVVKRGDAIDDSHLLGLRVVGFRKQTPFEQRQPNRLEVISAGNAEIHLRRGFIRIRRPAFDLEISVVRPVGQTERIERIGRSHRRRDHARRGLRAFNQAQAQITVLLARRVLRPIGRHAHHQYAFGIEAGVDFLQFEQTA